MRSELINEIFSVETEAEKIVSQAQQKGRQIVADAQAEGEKQLRVTLEQARAEREQMIEQAQQESQQRLAAVTETLADSDSDTDELQTCAERIADEMVAVLCKTSLGDLQS